MFVQSMLFAMLMNSKETGVNGGSQRDYLGSILQYKNIPVFLLLFFFPIYCTAISFILMSHTVPPVSHVLLLLFWHRSHILSKTITIFYAMYSFTCIGFPFYLPT